MDLDDIRRILDLVKEHDLSELELGQVVFLDEIEDAADVV